MKRDTTVIAPKRRQFLKQGVYAAPGIIALGQLVPVGVQGADSGVRMNVGAPVVTEQPRTQSTAAGSAPDGTGAEYGKPNLENTDQNTGSGFSDNSTSGINTPKKEDEQ